MPIWHLRTGTREVFKISAVCLHRAGGYADFGIAHVLLIDSWSDQEAIDVHHASPMMKQLSELRDKYDLHMTVERFVSEEYESDEKYLRK